MGLGMISPADLTAGDVVDYVRGMSGAVLPVPGDGVVEAADWFGGDSYRVRFECGEALVLAGRALCAVVR